MANEVTYSASLNVTKGLHNVTRTRTNMLSDQTGNGTGGVPKSVTTAEVSETLTGKGYVLIQNLDATNYVELGFATTVYPLKLRAGGPPFFMELNGTQTLYMRANTATCVVDIFSVVL